MFKILKEQLSDYPFDQDIPDLIQIGANQYAYHNQALQNFNFTYKDSLNLMNSSDYVKIIEQGMSFGAFKDGKLVSYALGQDKAIITHKDIQLTPNVERLINSIASFYINHSQQRLLFINDLFGDRS